MKKVRRTRFNGTVEQTKIKSLEFLFCSKNYQNIIKFNSFLEYLINIYINLSTSLNI